MRLEAKIRAKAKNVLESCRSRFSQSGWGEAYKKQLLKEMVQAMLKIVKTEVNIRLQEERHRKNK